MKAKQSKMHSMSSSLFLSGKYVMSPGIAGAFAGGLFSAVAIDPRLFR